VKAEMNIEAVVLAYGLCGRKDHARRTPAINPIRPMSRVAPIYVELESGQRRENRGPLHRASDAAMNDFPAIPLLEHRPNGRITRPAHGKVPTFS